jgi:hypothetical protein
MSAPDPIRPTLAELTLNASAVGVGNIVPTLQALNVGLTDAFRPVFPTELIRQLHQAVDLPHDVVERELQLFALTRGDPTCAGFCQGHLVRHRYLNDPIAGLTDRELYDIVVKLRPDVVAQASRDAIASGLRKARTQLADTWEQAAALCGYMVEQPAFWADCRQVRPWLCDFPEIDALQGFGFCKLTAAELRRIAPKSYQRLQCVRALNRRWLCNEVVGPLLPVPFLPRSHTGVAHFDRPPHLSQDVRSVHYGPLLPPRPEMIERQLDGLRPDFTEWLKGSDSSNPRRHSFMQRLATQFRYQHYLRAALHVFEPYLHRKRGEVTKAVATWMELKLETAGGYEQRLRTKIGTGWSDWIE